MPLSDLLSYGKSIILLAIILLFLLTIVFVLGYFLLYKKLGHGTKSINKKTCLLSGIMFGYLCCLLGAVFLTRGTHYGYRSIQLYPLRAYRDAWYHFSFIEWRNIIINILLFIPLGFLLPLYANKLKHFVPVLFIGLALTLAIESTQLLTHRGIFEIDDIINNTFGTIIGYGLVIFLLTWKKKHHKLRKLVYLSPLFGTICLFSCIFAWYHFQELGNLPSTYLSPVNMKEVEASTEIPLSADEGVAMIYRTKYASIEDATTFAAVFFNQKNVTIEEEETDIYENSILFYGKSRSLHLWVNYAGMTFRYTDFSQFDEGMTTKSTDELTLRERLQNDFHLDIPIEALFQQQDNGRYLFSLTNFHQDNILWNGTVGASYYKDDTIKSLDYNLIPYSPYKEESIISEEDAYQKIKSGKFNYFFYENKLKSLHVEDVTLSYELDTKGFYRPIYLFDVLFDGVEGKITISALK